MALRAGSELRSPSQDGLGSPVGTTTGPTTRYWPSGELREPQGELPTDRRFTGQRLEARTGLSDYQARFSSPQLGRFLQPDTLVPEPSNPQGLNRYAYALNNPLRYTDPSGHYAESALDLAFLLYDLYQLQTEGLTVENGLALAADVLALVTPGASGGGPAVRLAFAGGAAAGAAVGHVAAEVRGAQAAAKLLQIRSPAGQLPLPGFEAGAGSAGPSGSPTDTEYLQARAQELQNALDDFAQSRRTTAVLRTTNAEGEVVDVLASGKRDLDPVQEALQQAGEVIAKMPGEHAEVTAVEHAWAAGLIPRALAASRRFCPACAEFLGAAGAELTGPSTAVWP